MAGRGVTELFADFKFRVDLSGLKSFESQLSSIEGRINRINKMRIKNFNSNLVGSGSNKASSTAEKAAESTNKATESNRRYASSLGTIVSRYNQQEGALAKVRQDYAAVQAAYRNSEITYERRNRLLEQMARRYREIQTAAYRAEQATSKVGRPNNYYGQGVSAVGAFVPGFGGAFAGMQSYRTYQDIEGVRSALQAVYGDDGEERFKYLDETARYYGRSTTALGANYSRISAAGQQTGMDSGDVDKIFESVLASSTVFNLSNDDTKGVLLAIQQMMSKGQIMSEEFKNQLGERLPTAMGAMVKALGLEGQEDATAQVLKMMEAGELGTEVLPQFADALMEISKANGGLEKGLQRTSTTVGRFSNTLERSNRVFNESGYDAALKSLFSTMDFSLRNMQPLIKGLGESMQYFGLLVEAPIEAFSNLNTAGRNLIGSMDQIDPRLRYLAAGLVALTKPMRWIITRFAIIPVGILALTDLLTLGDSVFWKNWTTFVDQWNSIDGSWIDKLTNPEVFEPLIKAVTEIGVMVAGIMLLLGKVKGLKSIMGRVGGRYGGRNEGPGDYKHNKNQKAPRSRPGFGVPAMVATIAAPAAEAADVADAYLDTTTAGKWINDQMRASRTPWEYLSEGLPAFFDKFSSDDTDKIKDGISNNYDGSITDSLSNDSSYNLLSDLIDRMEDGLAEMSEGNKNPRTTTNQFTFGDITLSGIEGNTPEDFAFQFQKQLEENLASAALNEPETER